MLTNTNTELKTERKVTDVKKLDIFDVSEEVKETAIAECDKLNCDFVFICRSSTNPNYSYLYKVIGKKRNPLWENYEYCIWLLNTSLGGFHEGKYDISDIDAMKLTAESIYDYDQK